MTERLLGIYEAIILRNPRLSLLFVVLLAVAMAFGLPNFKIDASADSLTLEHDEDLDYFREINQRYGSGDFIVVTFSPKGMDLFSDQSLALLAELRDRVQQVQGVDSVLTILDSPLLYSPKVSVSELSGDLRTLSDPDVDRELAKQEFLTSPIYKNLVLSPDGQTTALLASFERDEQFTRMVRHRDALRLKRDTEGLSGEENAELQRVTQEFRDYRTAAAAKSFARVHAIRAIARSYDDRAELILGGPSMVTADMIDFIRSDMQVFGIGIVSFIVLLLAIIFRQPRWVILPLLTCLLSVEIMLGFLSWIDWRLTVISSNFVALLLIITMALTIHLIVRYREYLAEGPDRPQYDLVRDTVAFMARPCFYTVTTTIVAFVSLVVSDIRPVIDFGWMMTIGISLAFSLAFIVIPCGMLVLGKGKVENAADNSGALTLIFSRFTERHGILGLLIFSGLAVFGGWGASQLTVENRFIDYFRSDTEIYRGLSVIDAKLGGTTPLDIIINAPKPLSVEGFGLDGETDDPFGEEDPFGEDDPFAESDPFAEEDPFSDDPFAGDAFSEDESSAKSDEPQSYWFTGAGMGKLEQFHEYLESLPELGKVSSLVTVYHVARDLMEQDLNDLELAFLQQSLAGPNAEFLVDPYLNKEADQARITIRAKETEGNLRRAELLAKINQYATDELGFEQDQVRATSLLVLYNNMLQSLFRSQILTLGAVFLGIMGMFLVLFRSMKVAVIGIIPNLIAAFTVLGGMGAFGVPLDMMTITIAAITLGIGVDNTIHYIHRFKREFAVDPVYLDAMHRSHNSIGKALYYTSITIVIGFSILALSEFVPSIYFGLLTGVAMLAALMGALVLLPKLILMTRPFGAERNSS
ncbi:MAG: efflux RND transporter permease subunit [bacterium]